MNRDLYRAHRAGYRNALGVIRRQQINDSYADSSNCFQRERELAAYQPLHNLAEFHRAYVPVCADSAGFSAMHARWAARRKRVEYRVRCRKHDAELRARHDARYRSAA